MPFASPLPSTRLAVMPARLAACRLGIARVGFTPKDTDALVMPDAADDDYYAHRDQVVADNAHTIVVNP